MPEPGPTIAITDSEAVSLLSDLFAPFATIVLAVSGGADSSALMHLAADWQRSRRNAGSMQTPKLLVATVDHGLRPEAAAEAAGVAANAKALGFDHHTLVWRGPKPTTGVQSAARAARYHLLARLAVAQSGIEIGNRCAIATAHHENDQAETLLMRLARGSGIDGLAGMAVQAEAPFQSQGVRLLRPFLAIPKSRLVATLTARGQTWIEDPSNESLESERVRVRKAAPDLAAAGLRSGTLALSARRLARARTALDIAAAHLHASAVNAVPGVTASIQSVPFLAAAEELQVRVLQTLLVQLGGKSPPPRLAEAEALVQRLRNPAWKASTLAGCGIRRQGAAFLIHREPGRRELEVIALAPGQSALWDCRFLVTAGAAAPGAIDVRALAAPDLNELRRLHGKLEFASRWAALSVPSFWHEGQLLAVPYLGIVDPRVAAHATPASHLDKTSQCG